MRLVFTEKLEKSTVNPAVMIIFFNMLDERIAPHEKVAIINVVERNDQKHKLMRYTSIIFSTVESQERFYFNCHHAIDMSCSQSNISREPEPICLCGTHGKDQARCPKHRDDLKAKI